MIDWPVIAASLPDYLHGLWVTLALLALSLASGLLLSVPLATARVSRHAWLSRPVWLFTYLLRGTPLLVQLYLVYFGLAQFDWIRDSAAWPLLRSAWFCTWLTFALNTTAYTTEIFAGALRTTTAGEVEAAASLGMGRLSILRHIVWPSALRRALPQYGNEMVMMLHATALASTVSIVDLTRVARDVYTNQLLPVEAFGTVAVFYFAITFALVGTVKALERRYLRHLRPKQAAPQVRHAV